jgi:hypothetical protein
MSAMCSLNVVSLKRKEHSVSFFFCNVIENGNKTMEFSS